MVPMRATSSSSSAVSSAAFSSAVASGAWRASSRLLRSRSFISPAGVVARALVERNRDAREVAGLGAVPQRAALDARAGEQLLERQRVEHRLQRLAAADARRALRALLAGLVVGGEQRAVGRLLDQI